MRYLSFFSYFSEEHQMENIKGYFFSGGLLFFLLTQATLPNGSSRDHRNRVKDDHSEPILMTDFIYTFTGSRNYGAAKDTSKYKDCDSEGSVNVPFNQKSAISAYDDTVRNRYEEALKRMDEFVTWHLNPENRFWLVKALLDIIDNDDAVEEDDRFFISETGMSLAKAELESETAFCLPAFLVGMLHYTLTRRNGRNHEGAPTLDAISEKKPRKPRIYTGRLGEGITRRIDVAFDAPQRPEDAGTDNAASEAAVEPDMVITEDNADSDTGRDPSREQTDPQITVIQQQINVIQNGKQNINLTNNGEMTINL